MVAINGFTVSGDRAAIGIRTYTVPGTTVALPVRAEVAPLLIGYATEYHRTVERLVPGWCWGYAYRAVRGGTTPSFHSAGIAIDLNAPKHPLGTAPSASLTPAQIARIRLLCHKYGLRTGIDYVGRKDSMHVEVILPRAEALALVKRLQAPPAPAKPPAAKPPAYPGYLLKRGMRDKTSGGPIARVQVRLHVDRSNGGDGIFGPRTEAAVRSYQRTVRGLGVDGIVGPQTWNALF